MFALVDGNNFYASCERVFRPDLRNVPIVILSNNDGVIIARSNEAKALGVPMGLPYFKSKDIILKHKMKVFSSNYALYGDMSNRMMTILRTFSPDVEVYSIDEAFLKLTGFENFDLTKYGIQIRKTVLKSTGLPTGVGIAPTKALAKVANKIAKKYPEKTQSSYVIDTDEKRIKALKWTKIEDVWGIGRRHAKRLQSINIKTAYQFTQLSDYWVKKHMSVIGLRLKKELMGESVLDIEQIQRKKSIATTRSFDKTYTKFEDLKERVSTFAFSCSEKLRKQRTHCNSLMVFIHTSGFKKLEPQYYKSIVVKLPFSTHSSIDIVKYAIKGLELIYKEGYKYKKAGVIVNDLTPEIPKQLNLFEESNKAHNELMKVMDNINMTYGRHLLKLGSMDKKVTWKMKQENLSQRYSTCLKEVIEVKV
ncbi:MAG: SOS mutagenesis and repair protein UmuC [Bacteroidetes bacterium]|nr:MAG: SOS mutagenesis and repair protein UmuC [Bacteroidota bacterium]